MDPPYALFDASSGADGPRHGLAAAMPNPGEGLVPDLLPSLPAVSTVQPDPHFRRSQNGSSLAINIGEQEEPNIANDVVLRTADSVPVLRKRKPSLVPPGGRSEDEDSPRTALHCAFATEAGKPASHLQDPGTPSPEASDSDSSDPEAETAHDLAHRPLTAGPKSTSTSRSGGSLASTEGAVLRAHRFFQRRLDSFLASDLFARLYSIYSSVRVWVWLWTTLHLAVLSGTLILLRFGIGITLPGLGSFNLLHAAFGYIGKLSFTLAALSCRATALSHTSFALVSRRTGVPLSEVARPAWSLDPDAGRTLRRLSLASVVLLEIALLVLCYFLEWFPADSHLGHFPCTTASYPEAPQFEASLGDFLQGDTDFATVYNYELPLIDGVAGAWGSGGLGCMAPFCALLIVFRLGERGRLRSRGDLHGSPALGCAPWKRDRRDQVLDHQLPGLGLNLRRRCRDQDAGRVALCSCMGGPGDPSSMPRDYRQRPGRVADVCLCRRRVADGHGGADAGAPGGRDCHDAADAASGAICVHRGGRGAQRNARGVVQRHRVDRPRRAQRFFERVVRFHARGNLLQRPAVGDAAGRALSPRTHLPRDHGGGGRPGTLCANAVRRLRRRGMRLFWRRRGRRRGSARLDRRRHDRHRGPLHGGQRGTVVLVDGELAGWAEVRPSSEAAFEPAPASLRRKGVGAAGHVGAEGRGGRRGEPDAALRRDLCALRRGPSGAG
ncbi:hypothetical protein DFJ74DRAFT_357868 [Hyaloraphidium curvatum]|nr:hypothetical protein DFJ74DRAFT_357868 [Hyaloraphidium curvatum]